MIGGVLGCFVALGDVIITFLKLADLVDVQCWLSAGSSTPTLPCLCFKSFAKVPKVEQTIRYTHEHRQGTYRLDKHPHPNKIWHMTCTCDYDMKHDMTQTKKRRVSPPLGDFFMGKACGTKKRPTKDGHRNSDGQGTRRPMEIRFRLLQ